MGDEALSDAPDQLIIVIAQLLDHLGGGNPHRIDHFLREHPDLHTVFLDQLLQRNSMLCRVLGPDRIVETFAGQCDGLLQIIIQRFINSGIDATFLGRRRFPHTGPVVILGNLLVTKRTVRPGSDEFARIKSTSLKCLEHGRATHRLCGHANLGTHLGGQPRSAEFQPLEILDRFDLVTEPATPLRA